MEYKKGDTVMIYEDPITRTREEGKARLLKPLDLKPSHQNKMEFWRVKFISDQFICDRMIS